jgi:hypothetical protein
MSNEKMVEKLENRLKEMFKDAKHVEVKVKSSEIEIAIYDLPFLKTYLNMFFKNLKVSTTMVKKSGDNAMLYVNITFKGNVSETTLNKLLSILEVYYKVIVNGNSY